MAYPLEQFQFRIFDDMSSVGGMYFTTSGVPLDFDRDDSPTSPSALDGGTLLVVDSIHSPPLPYATSYGNPQCSSIYRPQPIRAATWSVTSSAAESSPPFCSSSLPRTPSAAIDGFAHQYTSNFITTGPTAIINVEPMESWSQYPSFYPSTDDTRLAPHAITSPHISASSHFINSSTSSTIPQELPEARTSSIPAPRPSSITNGRLDTFSVWEGAKALPVRNEVTTFPSGVSTYPQTTYDDVALRKWACELCGKRFKRSGTFNQHKRTHTNERPHVCTVPGCTASFHTSSNLKRHQRTHRGVEISQNHSK